MARQPEIESNKASADRWNAIVSGLNELFDQLMTAPAACRLEHNPRLPKEPGVYLFLESGRPMYVGQTRNLRQRIANHCRPSGSDNHATFAFLLAQRFGCTRRGSEDAQARFARSGICRGVHNAKTRVAAMEVKFVRCDDPELRTVSEVFVAVQLRTPHNDFETH
ncbi:MAG: GIY-YIG nuclease family protein [Solirubrobacteraceae bacterium]